MSFLQNWTAGLFSSIILVTSGNLPFGLTTNAAFAQRLDNLTPNKWQAFDPPWQFLSSGGAFQARNWCTLVPTGEGRVLFFEGFYRSDIGSSIYANALYQYDIDLNTIMMLGLSNWYVVYHADGSYNTVPTVQNQITPTPMDRHTYNQICYVPSHKSLYIIAGANQSGPDGHPRDFWRYALDEKRWIKIHDNPLPEIPDWQCPCEKNLLYFPEQDQLIFFYSTSKVFVFDLKTEKWTAKTVSGDGGTIGAKGVYDPRRKRFLFYGSAWVAQNSDQTNDFLAYYPLMNKWERISTPALTPGARSYASLAYVPKYDVVVLHGGGGENDTWIYQPARNSWQSLDNGAGLPVEAFNSLYFTYDLSKDVLVLFIEGDIWLMRYVGTVADIENRTEIPTQYYFCGHPNPSYGYIKFDFSPAFFSSTDLLIYDMQGRTIMRLTLPAGSNSYTWEGVDESRRRCPAGFYFVELRRGSQRSISRMLLLK